MNLPPWLREDSLTNNQNLNFTHQTPKPGFIDKTLQEIIHVAKETFFYEKIALSKGLLQELDPRLKVFALFLLLITLNLISNLYLLWSFYFLLLIISTFSNLSPYVLLKRVWAVVVLFGGVMAFPALFNWVRPGNPYFIVWDFKQPVHIGIWEFPATLALTKQGLSWYVLFITRLGISVSLAAVLTLTTRWYELLRSLRSLFVPKIFVTTLEMTYRYIHVFLIVIEEMLLARKARETGRSSGKEQRRFIASSLGNLFGKSLLMSEEVYFSMLARGYTGEPRSLERFRFSWLDAFVLGIVIMSSLTLYAADKVLGG